MMSNVEQSLYLYDVSQARNTVTKQAFILHCLDCMLVRTQDVFKNHPMILLTFSNPQRTYSNWLTKYIGSEVNWD